MRFYDILDVSETVECLENDDALMDNFDNVTYVRTDYYRKFLKMKNMRQDDGGLTTRALVICHAEPKALLRQ